MNGDRPRSGVLNENWLAAKAQYKQAIRAASIMYERKINDRLLNSMLKRDSQTFWSEWKNFGV